MNDKTKERLKRHKMTFLVIFVLLVGVMGGLAIQRWMIGSSTASTIPAKADEVRENLGTEAIAAKEKLHEIAGGVAESAEDANKKMKAWVESIYDEVKDMKPGARDKVICERCKGDKDVLLALRLRFVPVTDTTAAAIPGKNNPSPAREDLFE